MPDGVAASGWPAVEGKCRELGIRFRPWQPGVGRLILAKRDDGKYAATIGGTGLSIPRQVGKTFLVGAIVFALCLLRPRLTVIWTAHRLRTAEETFGKMQAFAKRKRIAPHIEKVVLGSGEEEVRFRNGSRILFGARESGFGLGFDEVDILIFDEAQRLRDQTLDDMIPATNQSRQLTSALLLFMGTPPRPTDPGEVFTRMRNDALIDKDADTGWVEFGADDGFVPTPPPDPMSDADWKQIAKANPSYPGDTPREAILRMRKKLGPDSLAREGYGLWDDPDAEIKTAINLKQWAKLGGDEARGFPQPERVALTFDVSPDRKRSSIAVAGDAPDGRVMVLVTSGPGTAWVVPEVARLVAERDVVEVAVQPTSLAGALIPDLVKAGVEFEALTSTHMGQACVGFIEGVKERRWVHMDQAELDAAVRNARTRMRTDAEIWDRRDRSIDISPLVAASTAASRWVVASRELTFNVW